MHMPPPPKPKPPKLGKIVSLLKDPKVLIPVITLVAILLLAGGAWLIFDSWLIALVVALAVVLIALVVILLRTLLRQDRDDRIERGIGEQEQFASQQQMQAQHGALVSHDPEGLGVLLIEDRQLAQLL